MKKMQMILQIVSITLTLYVPQVDSKAMAMRYINRIEDDMERKTYERANNVFWGNRMNINPDTSEWGDMMWEIEHRYMKEVENTGSQRVDFQLNMLWTNFMQKYRDEIERLADENEGGPSARVKMSKIMDKCKAKKEAEYFEQPEEVPEEEGPTEPPEPTAEEKLEKANARIAELEKELAKLKVGGGKGGKGEKGGKGRSGGRAAEPAGRSGGRALEELFAQTSPYVTSIPFGMSIPSVALISFFVCRASLHRFRYNKNPLLDA